MAITENAAATPTCVTVRSERDLQRLRPLPGDRIELATLDALGSTAARIVGSLSDLTARGALVSCPAAKLTVADVDAAKSVLGAIRNLLESGRAARIRDGVRRSSLRRRPAKVIDMPLAVRLRAEGASWRQLSVEFGVSVRTMRRRLGGAS